MCTVTLMNGAITAVSSPWSHCCHVRLPPRGGSRWSVMNGGREPLTSLPLLLETVFFIPPRSHVKLFSGLNILGVLKSVCNKGLPQGPSASQGKHSAMHNRYQGQKRLDPRVPVRYTLGQQALITRAPQQGQCHRLQRPKQQSRLLSPCGPESHW